MPDQIAISVPREGDVVLRDGSTVHIRVMRPEDEAGLRFFTKEDLGLDGRD